MTRSHRTTRRLLAAGTLGLAVLLAACVDSPDTLLDSAHQYMQKGEYKAAIIQIKNALQAEPDRAEARFLLGQALLESGEAVGAETELRRALALQYPADLVQPALARALLSQHQDAKVVEGFAALQLGTPQARADVQLSLAQAYARLEQPGPSDQALQSALQTDPGFAPAQLEQARRLAARGDVATAQAQLDTVIAKAPQSADAWKLRGDLLAHSAGHADDALAAYRKAVALKPDHLAAHSALLLLLLQQAQLDAATAQMQPLQKLAPNHPYTQYLGAMLAFQKQDYKGACDLVQRSLRTVPSNAAALELAGACELQQQHLPQAQGYLSRALEAAPALVTARRLLVQTHLRQQQPVLARDTLLPGLQHEPIDPSLLALAGEVFLRNGDTARAQEYFNLAQQKNPKDGRIRTSLALVEMAQGQTGPSMEALQDIASSDAGTSADMVLIGTLMQREEYAQALKAIAVLEHKQPKQPQAPYLRARVQMATQQVASARESLQRALALDASYYPAIAALVALDLADKKPADARRRLQALLEKQPRHVQALLALADVAARSGAPASEVIQLLTQAVAANPSDVASRLVLIDAYQASKDTKGATTAAQAAAQALPDEPRIVDALGRSLQAAGDSNQALTAYRRLAALVPQSPLAQWRIADAQLHLNDREGAIQSLQKALTLQSDFLDAQRALVALYLGGGQVAQALDIARSVQKQRPNEDTGYVIEADIHASRKQWDKAVGALRAGLKRVNTTPLAMKLHTSLLASGKGAEAAQLSTQWQKDNPQDAAFAFYLGDQAMARQDYAVAEQHFASALQLQPNNPLLLNNQAWVLGKLKKDGALPLAERAVALAPLQPDYMDTLAALHSERGNYPQAVEMQSRALALQPHNPMLKLDLAIIHLRAGKKDLARKSLDELSALGDGFAAQTKVRAMQKELEKP